MENRFSLHRTTTGDPRFQELVNRLDHELWVELQEDQETYDQYNKVDSIQTAVVVCSGETPVAIGCFKEFDSQTVEIKRMFVEKTFRGKGLSKMVLSELENWAAEKGYRSAILETSIHFTPALGLYQSNGYEVIPNYAQYEGFEESVCLRKTLSPQSPS